MKMIKGAKVSDAELLKEGFSVYGKWLIANVNEENIFKLLKKFIKINQGPFCLILEVPCSLTEEKMFENNVDTENNEIVKFHNNVYYFDFLSCGEALSIISDYGKILINDGFCLFGFGNTKGDEIVKTKYNVVKILSYEDLIKYC